MAASHIQMVNVVLAFASVIITYFPMPAFHFHHLNNHYSNEPLGFGRVSWQLLGLLPKTFANSGLSLTLVSFNCLSFSFLQNV